MSAVDDRPLFSVPRDARAANRAWLAALLLAGAVASFAPCLMPFTALAVALAATTRLRTALAAIAGLWTINQFVGFAFLDFPHTADAFGWGVVIALGALAATLVAAAVIRRAPIAGKAARVLLAFVLAFVTYEALLLAATPALGGLATFTPAIVGTIAFENALWLAAFVLGNEALARAVRPWLGRGVLIARGA